MKRKKTFSQEELRYLKLLAQQYPTVQAASSEIINLQAILNLPKGTEHFISDLHGEYEAFLHILNSCSGVMQGEGGRPVRRHHLQGGPGRAVPPSSTTRRTSWSSSTRHMRIWTSGTASPSTGSLRSAGGCPPSTPGPRCARPCPRTTPTSSTSCSTPTTTRRTSGTTTRTSSPPSST